MLKEENMFCKISAFSEFNVHNRVRKSLGRNLFTTELHHFFLLHLSASVWKLTRPTAVLKAQCFSFHEYYWISAAQHFNGFGE